MVGLQTFSLLESNESDPNGVGIEVKVELKL